MKNNLTTEAGQSNAAGTAYVDAINQVFALFQLNYHNQYFKAFANNQDLVHIKRLWLEALAEFTPQTIMRAGKDVVKQSEYLPTLKKMLDICQKISAPNLPDTHQAFIEACQAPSPKASFNWSHAIVYHAGIASDWYFLQSNPQHVTLPVFKQHYETLRERLKNGESFSRPSHKSLANTTMTPLKKSENKKFLAEFRKNLDI